ncbi:MAG: hypothetical protein GY938_11955 [Ketobacter sp.]|nr:hypothetical protein [Ketobacter sp.]
MNLQRGQAMSEFLVSMVWAIPFIFMVVAISNMLKVQTEAHKAARYVAWERTAYSGDDYQAKLSDPINGFDAEVTSRFFVNGGVGFSSGSVGSARRWFDWESKNSIIELDGGVRLVGVADADSFQGQAVDFLDSSSSQVNWMRERSGVEINTAAVDTLQVDFSTTNNYALSDNTGFVPHVNSSYVLVADSWAPSNDRMFSDRVDGLRESIYSRAQRWYQNTPATRAIAGVFDEIGEKMFINEDDPEYSFDMVSPTQSSALPSSLEAYEP